ncbi:DUF4270 family protein [Hymenobacter humi]|uniref:DUF4270 family protein n=1 Tax=Hymenobacter humi TaxID=1411620 RepID=A0ABW2U188_9BACT
MGFDKVYGSSTTPVKFDVYKLAAPLDERQAYDSGTTTATGDLLGQNLTSRLDRTRKVTTAASGTTPASTTIVPDQTVRLLLQRRAFPAAAGRPAITAIPLPFATDLFDKLSLPNFGQTQLDAALKGLVVAPSAGHNSSIVSFARSNAQRMIVYFHAADTLRRTYSLFFGPVFSGSQGLPPARDPRYYTQITNDLAGTPLSALADTKQAIARNASGETSYVQEGTGLGTRIKFKGLEELTKTPGLTINRAELRVPVKPFSNALFPNPSQLYAVEVGTNNEVLQRTANFIPTNRIVQADGSNQLGVGNPAFTSLTDASTSQSYYSLPITSYLQAYLTGKIDGNPAALVLVPTSVLTSSPDRNPILDAPNVLSLNRAALDAANISLRVYYSKR